MGWWGYWLLGWLVRPQLLVVTMIVIMTADPCHEFTGMQQPKFPKFRCGSQISPNSDAKLEDQNAGIKTGDPNLGGEPIRWDQN